MKKSISLVIVFIILFTLAFPIYATTADEDDQVISRETLIAMGCELFPEYASKIKNPPVMALYARSEVVSPTVVNSQTKSLSENETLTYMEFGNGVTTLIYNKLWHESYNSANGRMTHIKGNFSCVCNMSLDTLFVSDFHYVIDSLGYDYISSFGTDDTSSCQILARYTKQYEDVNSNAYIEYRVLFYPFPYQIELGFPAYSAVIRLEVGDNTFVTTVNGS